MPRQVKHSKHDARDALSEMLYGADGAMRFPTVMMCFRAAGAVWPRGTELEEEAELSRVGMWGVSLGGPNPTNDDGEHQVWECEVIVIPRRKFRKGMRGARADQMLCCGRMGDPAVWEEQIFGPPAEVPAVDGPGSGDGGGV